MGQPIHKLNSYIETKRKCLTVVIFHHMIINSFEREEACTKFTTAEDEKRSKTQFFQINKLDITIEGLTLLPNYSGQSLKAGVRKKLELQHLISAQFAKEPLGSWQPSLPFALAIRRSLYFSFPKLPTCSTAVVCPYLLFNEREMKRDCPK